MTDGRRRLRLAGRITGHLLLLALVAGWWTFLRPEAFGGSTSFVMVSGESMEPTYRTGDLVLVRKQPTYEVGDVVAFRTAEGDRGGGLLVIHRVVDVRPDGRLVLQGDNNDFVDPWSPTPDQVAGERFLELRGWGTHLATLVQSPILLGAAFGGLVTFLIVLGKPKPKPESQAPDDEPVAGDIPDAVAEPAVHRRRVGRLVAYWLAVGAIAVLGSSAPGSAAHLDVDGGVIQSFTPPLPEVPAEPEVVEPDAVEPEVIEPDVAEPDAAEPEVAEAIIEAPAEPISEP